MGFQTYETAAQLLTNIKREMRRYIMHVCRKGSFLSIDIPELLVVYLRLLKSLKLLLHYISLNVVKGFL